MDLLPPPPGLTSPISFTFLGPLGIRLVTPADAQGSLKKGPFLASTLHVHLQDVGLQGGTPVPLSLLCLQCLGDALSLKNCP